MTTLVDVDRPSVEAAVANGPAVAAALAAAIGSFALGVIVLLNEAGVVPIPAIYAPAGGVSGRTTVAVVLWLMAWAVLHFRWRGRDVPVRPASRIGLILIALGIAALFPPVWQMF
jgi:hypothetical protein